MKYFTSDLHYNHAKLLEWMPESRPHATVDEMNEFITTTINDVCTEKDELYILGDVLMGQRKHGLHLIRELRPRLYLVRGNHDTFKVHEEEELFEAAWDYKEVKDNKRTIVCFHFPISVWHNCHYGRMHLHGHSHGQLKEVKPNRFDIGWDVWQRPVSFDEVYSWKTSEVVKHH